MIKIKYLLLKLFNYWLDEYAGDTRYGLKGKVLIKKRTEFQTITIFESNDFGKALLLDNCWMSAEKQEKNYHECIVHPALSAAETIDNILIIGGGDGGTARECLKYEEVKNIDMIEIDKMVIEMSQKYLSKIGGNCWKDPRLKIKIKNGISWVKTVKDNYYDVIIVDGSDPKGPAEGLFNKSFFENCKRILKSYGVFVTQSESPEAFEKIHVDIINIIREVFPFADPLYGNVPIYPSGLWSWTFAALDQARYLNPIHSRCNRIAKTCDIWSPRWQKGSFEAMPAKIERKLKQ